jgi:hypothetical protein
MKENKTELLTQALTDKLIVAAGVFEDEMAVHCSQQAINTRDLCTNHEEVDT